MTTEQLNALEKQIAASFWRANDMTRKQAEDYAGLAMDHVKKAMKDNGIGK